MLYWTVPHLSCCCCASRASRASLASELHCALLVLVLMCCSHLVPYPGIRRYLGQSLGRVGADFNGLLLPLFEGAVADLMLVHWDDAVLRFGEQVRIRQWAVPSSATTAAHASRSALVRRKKGGGRERRQKRENRKGGEAVDYWWIVGEG